MSKTPTIPVELLSALALFVKELDSHLIYFKSLLAELERASSDARISQLQQRAKAMEHRFHVIKGAASFFKLSDLRACAVEGEILFKDGNFAGTDDEVALSHLKRIFNELATESLELRESFAELH